MKSSVSILTFPMDVSSKRLLLFLFQKIHNMTQPDWITDEVADKLWSIRELEFKYYVYTPEMTAIRSGWYSGFSQTRKIGNIVNFVFSYICIFLHYLHYMILVNVKLEVSGCKRIIFQGCRL